VCREELVKEEAIMPQYVFLCQDCSKEFTQILHIADLEKGGIVCPHSERRL
jgi:predicted nucleic acid-binding Zn ribbon protein